MIQCVFYNLLIVFHELVCPHMFSHVASVSQPTGDEGTASVEMNQLMLRFSAALAKTHQQPLGMNSRTTALGGSQKRPAPTPAPWYATSARLRVKSCNCRCQGIASKAKSWQRRWLRRHTSHRSKDSKASIPYIQTTMPRYIICISYINHINQIIRVIYVINC